MNLYTIIQNETLLKEFIDWLPNLGVNEKFYLSLFARKKYCNDLIKSNDKTQLKRFTATKENMVDKIKQLEIPLGRWKLREMKAPQESLVLYIMPNPRCMKKANHLLLKKCADLIYNGNDGYNVQSEAISCIQKSKSRSFVVDFDIDDKSVDLNLLKEVFVTKPYKILETRGGYHILVKPQLATFDSKTKNWHGKIRELFPVDQSADQMIPVPGTYQGGFMPKFIEI